MPLLFAGTSKENFTRQCYTIGLTAHDIANGEYDTLYMWSAMKQDVGDRKMVSISQ